DQPRDLHEHRIVHAQEELVDFAACRRALASVVQDDLEHPLHADEVVNLDLVIVPCLHDPGIGGGDVRLAGLGEHVVVGAQGLHETAALVRDDLEDLRADVLDHGIPSLPRSVHEARRDYNSGGARIRPLPEPGQAPTANAGTDRRYAG